MPVEFQEWSLPTETLGKSVRVYDQLDSTNTLALTHADDPAQHGLAILARQQTAGRGQYGRTWLAPAGSSVLMSLLLFPPESLRRPAVLTAWAAVSVCETILKLANVQAKIKWPNDVLIHGKKISGILIEQRTIGNSDFPLATAVGIGLNVTQSAALFADAGLTEAASLAMFGEELLASDDVAKALLRELDTQYSCLINGDLATLESLWKWRLGLLGKPVIVEAVQITLRGRLLEVAFSGIEIEVKSGEVVRLAPESVKHLHALA